MLKDNIRGCCMGKTRRIGERVAAEKWKVVAITLLAVVAVSVGETLLTKGMKQTGNGPWWQILLAAVTNRYVVAGMLLMSVYFCLYMTVLKLAPLSFVLPLTAVSFLIGGVLAKFYLHEEVGPMKWFGYLIIMSGVVLVGLSEAGGK
jgi:drug/metabolite transporter (DMT)-like permease